MAASISTSSASTAEVKKASVMMKFTKIPTGINASLFWGRNMNGHITFQESGGDYFWIGEQSLYRDEVKHYYPNTMALLVQIPKSSLESNGINDYVNEVVRSGRAIKVRADDDARRLLNTRASSIDLNTLRDTVYHSSGICSELEAEKIEVENNDEVLWAQLGIILEESSKRKKIKAEKERIRVVEYALDVVRTFVKTDGGFKEWIRKFLDVLAATGNRVVNDNSSSLNVQEVEYVIVSRKHLKADKLSKSSSELKEINDSAGSRVLLREGDWSNRGTDNAFLHCWQGCGNCYYLHSDGKIHLSDASDYMDYSEVYSSTNSRLGEPFVFVNEDKRVIQRSVALSVAELKRVMAEIL